jgi:hypothetical protein
MIKPPSTYFDRQDLPYPPDPIGPGLRRVIAAVEQRVRAELAMAASGEGNFLCNYVRIGQALTENTTLSRTPPCSRNSRRT